MNKIANGSIEEYQYYADRLFLRLANFYNLGSVESLIFPWSLNRFIDPLKLSYGSASSVFNKEILSEKVILAAIESHEISPKFEPKIDLVSGNLYGFEVLAKWRELSPEYFIPRIEQLGLLDQMLFSLIKQASKFVNELKVNDLEISFNVSATQICSVNFAERLHEVISSSFKKRRGIVLELTETSAITAPLASLENILKLRLSGYGLALDDFGSGFSTLNRLCSLPFTEIKLDKYFVKHMGDDPKCKKIIQGIIDLAGSINLPLVIEGIETMRQLEEITSMGGRMGQGFLFVNSLDGGGLKEFINSWSTSLTYKSNHDYVDFYSYSLARIRNI